MVSSNISVVDEILDRYPRRGVDEVKSSEGEPAPCEGSVTRSELQQLCHQYGWRCSHLAIFLQVPVCRVRRWMIQETSLVSYGAYKMVKAASLADEEQLAAVLKFAGGVTGNCEFAAFASPLAIRQICLMVEQERTVENVFGAIHILTSKRVRDTLWTV